MLGSAGFTLQPRGFSCYSEEIEILKSRTSIKSIQRDLRYQRNPALSNGSLEILLLVGSGCQLFLHVKERGIVFADHFQEVPARF